MNYHKLNRDPILSEVTDIIEQATRNGMTLQYISNKCGVSTTCMRQWIKGKTRKPQNVTIDFVLRACGYSRQISPIKSNQEK